MKSTDLRAELSIETEANGQQVVTLNLIAKKPKDIELLDRMGWGRLQGVDGLGYCRTNTIYPHSIGGIGDGKYGLMMTVNFDPWERKPVPSVPQ